MFSKIRAFKRLGILALGFVLWIPIYQILLWLAPQTALLSMRYFYGFCFYILGITLKVQGAPLASSPTLFVSNHASYTDILILGFLLPARFISKEEVSHWPLIGWIAKKQGSLFVERKRHATHHYVKRLQQGLSEGNSFILFPEGTSSNACQVLPFHSSFFECLDVAPLKGKLYIQPLSLEYAYLDGFPMGRFLKKHYAWTGKLDFFQHLWSIAQLRKITVLVKFYDALNPEHFSSRKRLAETAWLKVNEGFFNE